MGNETATVPATAATNAKPKTGFLASLSARMARISQFLLPQADDGTGVSELWNSLDNVLRATEPGYEYIHQVYTDTQVVVYCCYPGREWKDYRRTYSLDAAGNVTLNDDRVDAVYRGVWEPVETVAATPAAHSQCTCGAASANSIETVNANETNTEEETMENETGNAAAATAPVNATTPATPTPTAPATPSVNSATPATPSIDRAALLSTLGITENDLVAIRVHTTAQTDRKQVLVSALAEAQDTFSTEQLNAMDTATLEGIADLVAPSIGVNLNANANVVLGDFRGARPRVVGNTSNDTYTPPDPHGVNALLYGGSVKAEKK